MNAISAIRDVRDHRPLFVAALLTWVSGFVDAVGFLALGHIYTANMSGNSVSIGIEAASQNWPEFLFRLWPVVTYFIGLFVCRVLIDVGERKHVKSIASAVMLLEIALLVPVCVLSGVSGHVPRPEEVSYVALLALAMGVQNGALTKFCGLTLHTGFVTGTIVKCAEETANYALWVMEELQKRRRLVRLLRESGQQSALRIGSWLAAMWTFYVVGAVFGALGTYAYSFRSLAVAMIGLVVVIWVDLRDPLESRSELEPRKKTS